MSIIDEKWEQIFEKYPIRQEIEKNGRFVITADEIREFKEPRLMTKFDTRESLPSVFEGKIGILPLTRGSYVLGEFELYQDFPESSADITEIQGTRIPEYFETIDIHEIRSEASAIHVMGLAGILDDFLGEEGLRQTVSGRMGSGSFDFHVYDRKREKRQEIFVQNSQVEIDGGFENRNSFAVLEGKNVVHSNFLVRQLYYPARIWDGRIRKPVRPVFLVYSNNIFHLLEYEFTDLSCYNSIRLVQEKKYSLEDTRITEKDLREIWKKTNVKPEPDVTFVQADSFEKVISLVENLNETPMTRAEIAELFGFRERQSDYYYNACRYLGLADKHDDESGVRRVFITGEGERLLGLNYKSRQLEYVRLIFEHQIFHEMFEIFLRTGEIPDRRTVAGELLKLRVCSSALAGRRASSVCGWLRWIAGLTSCRN